METVLSIPDGRRGSLYWRRLRATAREDQVGARLKLLTAGKSTHVEGVLVRGGRWRRVELPALFAWIEHPRLGTTLFDTGYSPRFLELTSRFPDRLYGLATPVSVDETASAARQLAALGVEPGDVRRVILSHFHADHVAGVRDFPSATYVYSASALDDVRHRRGLSRLLGGFLPGLLPEDFAERSAPVDWSHGGPLPEEMRPFERGVDLAGDGSVVAIELPGHTVGQLGLFVRTDQEGEFFLTADACWVSRGYQESRMPHPLVRPIFASWQATRETLGRIHELALRRPDLRIVPSHCAEALSRCPTSVR
ncbi:MAG: MBL fold metallo-hydrolase [Candidatus Wallbacteria bacterium]|nr:MBL fold metallo-hydrolase [Candidatus Wallbacteria bacterium]